MRFPSEERLRPSAARRIPSFCSSSLNLPIAFIISAVSGERTKPFSLSSVAFTRTITRIAYLLFELCLLEQRTEFCEIDSDPQIFFRCNARAALALELTQIEANALPRRNCTRNHSR